MKQQSIKKLLATALSISVAMTGLIGCGSSAANTTAADAPAAAESAESDAAAEDVEAADTATAADSGEQVNLSFSIWSDEENYISKVVDQYNSSQDKIKVTLSVIPESDYDDNLKVMLAGGTDVDLVDIRGVSQMANYAGQGALLDITDKINNDSDLDTSKYGNMWSSSDVDGSYFALPTRTTCWALYYNPDLLAQAGVANPEQMTWEEYVDYSAKVAAGLDGATAADGSKIYAGYWVPWIYHFYAVQSGVYADSKDTSKIKASLDLLNTLWTNGSHYSFVDVSSETYDYFSEFQNGHVALLPNGEWVVNMLINAAKNGEAVPNWEVAPMPVPEGVEAGTSWGQFQFAAITSSCKHPDEAYDFLSYLCGAEGSEVYASTGMIHAYSTDGAASALADASTKESVHFLIDAKKVQEQPNTTNYQEYLNIMKENAQLYFLGEEDLDKCMSDYADQTAGLGAK